MIDNTQTAYRLKPLADCPACKGSGDMDSGGTQPWGEPIYLLCECMRTDKLREVCSHCGANSWRWLFCSFRGSTPQGDVDIDQYECTSCGNKQDHA